MEIPWLSIICLLIFAPTNIYNVLAMANVGITYCIANKNKGVFYSLGVVLISILAVQLSSGGIIAYAIGLSNDMSGDKQLVITSLSMLLSFYVSYYHRFSKHLWLKRSLY